MTLQPTPALYIVWLVGILGKALLVAVLLIRRRYATFPVFTSYAVMMVTKSLVLLWYSFHDEHGAYFYAYYALSILESLLILAVVFEVFDKVFSRRRVLRAGLMRGFVVCYAVTGVLALSVALINISAYPLRVMAWANAVERAVIFVAFGSFAATAFFSSYLRVPWHRHAFGIASGFLLTLSINAVFAAILATQFRATAAVLRYVPMFGILLSEVAWIEYLRKDEPELRPVTPDVLRELRAFVARAEI